VKPKGFTLVECLTAMALGLFVVCASLEFFVVAEKVFFKLKDREETGQSVFAALDKMKTDLHRAGEDIVPALRFGLVDAVELAEDALLVRRAGATLSLAEDAGAGDRRLVLNSVGDLRPGRGICLWDETKGEAHDLAAVETGTRSVILETPLGASFRREGTTVVLLETTVLFLDEGSGTLRRRVNLSSAQPLLDGVASADFRYDPERNLAVVRLEVLSLGGRAYEVSIFPKNPAAAR
jgi:prepilin-type N-terminal cleavage/methylation domain-containing protein